MQPRNQTYPALLLAVLAACVLAAAPAAGRTIEWGNAVGDTVVDSQGQALGDSYIFELGSFGIFVPTEFNLGEWEANWKVFDRITAPASEGWNSTFSYFSSSATLQPGGTSSESPPLSPYVFNPGEQAFIWIFNVLDLTPATEWALLTNNSSDGNAADDWLFPAPGDKTDLPVEWRVSDASAVIFGGLDDDQGPGNYTVDPPAFHIQTHIIPEPSGALLLGISMTIALVVTRSRRQRRMA